MNYECVELNCKFKGHPQYVFSGYEDLRSVTQITFDRFEASATFTAESKKLQCVDIKRGHINVSNNIHAVSRIEEQRRRMKNNEENNPNLLFMLFYVLCITICAFNNHFEYKNFKKIKKNDIV